MSNLNVENIDGLLETSDDMLLYCNDSAESVTIPEGVTKIGKSAFSGCTSLAEIHFGGTREQWYAVKKGEVWNKDVPAKDVLVRKK